MSKEKSKKSWLKGIIITLLVLAVIIGGGYWFIHSNQAKEEIKTQIISTIENALDRGVYIGKVKNYSLKSVTLSDFKIFKDHSLKEEDLIFQAEEVVASYDLDLLSLLKKEKKQETVLNIENVTFIKPWLTLIRDKNGVFDFMEKFNLQLASFPDFYVIKKVSLEEGELDYIDYLSTKEDGLLTSVKNLNGYFNLTELPKVEFDCSGKRKEDDTPLHLKGYFFTEKVEYVLDFTFKDAEIAHFQYYFIPEEMLQVKKGLFDAQLRLANATVDGIPGKVNWQGNISVRDTDFSAVLGDSLIELNQLSGSALFDSEKINLEDLTANYGNFPFSLKGELYFADKLSYHLKLMADNFELNDLIKEAQRYISLPAGFSLKGSSSLEIEVKGLENNWQVEGELSTPKGNVAGYDFSNLFASLAYDAGKINLEKLKAEIGGGLIEGSGRINLGEERPEYDFSFDFSNLKAESDLLKPFFSGYGEIFKGEWLSGKIDLKGIMAEGEKTHLAAQIKVGNREGKGLSLQAEGSIAAGQAMDLTLKVEEISLEGLGQILNYEAITGEASFIGTLTGLLGDPKVKGKIEAKEGQIAKLPFDYLAGELDYQNNKLKLEELVFKNEKEKEGFAFNFKGKGNIDFSEKKNIRTDFILKIEPTELNFLAQFLNSDFPLSGLAQGEIRGEGIGPRIAVQGDLTLKEVNLANFKGEFGKLAFALKVEDNQVKIENMVWSSAETQFFAQGEIDLAEGFPLNLRVNFLNQKISELASYFSFSSPDFFGKFRGEATGSLEIKGTYTSPDLYLSALIEDAQLEGVPLNSLEIKLEKVGSLIKVNELKLSQRKGQLVASGSLGLAKDNPSLDFELSAEKVDLNQLANLLGIAEDEIQGLISFQAEAKGDLNFPTFSLSARVEKGGFRDFVFDYLTFEALYKEDSLEVKQFVLNKEGHQLKGKGNIPYKFSFKEEEKVAPSFRLADLPLSFILSLEDTDLSFLEIFFPPELAQVQGLSNGELKLSGTLNQPILKGNITLKEGGIELYSAPLKIDNLNASLEVEDDLVKIKEMNFQLDQHKLYASGDIVLKNLRPEEINLDIWTNQEELAYPDIFRAGVEFKVKVHGLLTSPQLEGKVTLSQGEVNWKDNNTEIQESASNLLSKLSGAKGDIDLEVEILDDLIVRTNDFDLKLGGSLKVQGDLAIPRLNGGLQIKQGYINFLDKKFRVTEGKITAVDSKGEDMVLDIRAKTQISNTEVSLKVGGILAQPSITLTSSPSLSELEIISLLIFNKNYIGLSQGEIEIILREELLNLIAQGLSISFLNQIEREIANSLGLDEFNLETIFKEEQDSASGFALFPDLALESLALKVGKYFSDNLYLTYSVPLGEMGIGDLGLEYKLTDDLSFSTQIGSIGLKDEELEFKLEFKLEF